MKVYMFRMPHFCHSETLYVLAESEPQAIKIVMKKTKDNYDFVSKCLSKTYNNPQIILNIKDTD